jgi:hypothetical protein
MMHSNQTGRFLATLSRGNKCIMVLVKVNGNYIDTELMKNKSEGSMVKAYLALWNQLPTTVTVRPKTHIMDNKASEEYKKGNMKEVHNPISPTRQPQTKSCRTSNTTFKTHFKAILAGVDDTFPMKLWDRLLTQTILTLNFLHQSNTVPTISAHQYVHGNFDYNKMPLAPMGCAVQLHESSKRRGTWSANSIDGWYLQTSPEHN